MSATTKLVSSRSRLGNVGIITLNNPASLNALSIDMIYSLQDVLKDWYKNNENNNNNNNNAINLVLMKSTTTTKPTTVSSDNSSSIGRKSPKSFCAGGDVKQVYLNGIQNTKLATEFFKQEYYVNYMLATKGFASANDNLLSTPTPPTTTLPPVVDHVAIWDGIVMGGGVGISIWNQYRIVTENTIWAMPETSIGLFPDVGSMYWMTRSIPIQLATYLTITGSRLSTPIDLLYSGIGTHYIPSNQLHSFEHDLVEFCSNNTNNYSNSSSIRQGIEQIVQSYHTNPTTINSQNDKSILQKHATFIESVFAPANDDSLSPMQNQKKLTMEDIMQRLEQVKHEDEFYQRTYDTILDMSPTSCKVTLEGLYRSKYINQSIEENLQMEYRLASACVRDVKSDFYVGIKSKLIDKKKDKPSWSPSTLEEVTADIVDSYFAPVDDEWSVPSEFRLSNHHNVPATSNL